MHHLDLLALAAFLIAAVAYGSRAIDKGGKVLPAAAGVVGLGIIGAITIM
ncbi:MAG: hypothetical protein RRB13_04350 [bacterium]|nr:hypothetical protein [bacterium]